MRKPKWISPLARVPMIWSMRVDASFDRDDVPSSRRIDICRSSKNDR